MPGTDRRWSPDPVSRPGLPPGLEAASAGRSGSSPGAGLGPMTARSFAYVRMGPAGAGGTYEAMEILISGEPTPFLVPTAASSRDAGPRGGVLLHQRYRHRHHGRLGQARGWRTSTATPTTERRRARLLRRLAVLTIFCTRAGDPVSLGRLGNGDRQGKARVQRQHPLEPGADDMCTRLPSSRWCRLCARLRSDLIVANWGRHAHLGSPHAPQADQQRVPASREGTLDPVIEILALGGGYDLFRTARCWTLAWHIEHLEPRDEFAGLVGGMMFGPEMEVGSLYDYRTSLKAW